MTAILKRLKTEGLGHADIFKLVELVSDTNKSIHQQTTLRALHPTLSHQRNCTGDKA
jgi:hypothetical protein